MYYLQILCMYAYTLQQHKKSCHAWLRSLLLFDIHVHVHVQIHECICAYNTHTRSMIHGYTYTHECMQDKHNPVLIHAHTCPPHIFTSTIVPTAHAAYFSACGSGLRNLGTLFTVFMCLYYACVYVQYSSPICWSGGLLSEREGLFLCGDSSPC